MANTELQTKPEDKKNSIKASVRGILFLVLIMVGIRLLAALSTAAGWIAPEEKKEKESQETILEHNSQRELVSNSGNNEGIANLPLMIYVETVEYKDGILTVRVDNQSGYHMSLKKEYKLEQKTDGDWTEIPALPADKKDAKDDKNEEGKTETDAEKVLQLNDLEQAELKVNLNVYGSLSAGAYRLTIDDRSVEFELK